jgi:dTDP-4-dehydrorhamnose reductase
VSKVPLLKAIPATAYPTPARRPGFSVLNKENTWSSLPIAPVYWRAALVEMLQAYKKLQTT